MKTSKELLTEEKRLRKLKAYGYLVRLLARDEIMFRRKK